MAVKIPPLLHKMSQAAQKAWYKKNNMEMPASKAPMSAAKAKVAPKPVAKPEPVKKPLSADERMAAIKKAAEKNIRRGKESRLRAAFGGEPMGAQYDNPISIARAGGTIKGYRLGEANQANKMKKNEYVRQMGLKAMKAGKVDPARGYVPTRVGREKLKETNGEYNRFGQPKAGSVDIDPKAGDSPPKYTKRKPAQYKPQKEEAMKSNRSPSNYPGARLQRDNMKTVRTVRTVKRVETPQEREDRLSALATGYKAGRWAFGGKYEQVEAEPMNEVSKKEAEAVLGGPTKEKPKMPPGKQPAGYRYVRGLARKAMKAGLKEAKKPDASMAMTDQLKNKAITDKDKRTLGKVADLMAAQKKLDKKNMKEESEMQYIEEKLTAADPASKWISDFVKSDNPKFAGKSKKERIQQALGAYYAAKRGTNEENEIEEGTYPLLKPGQKLKAMKLKENDDEEEDEEEEMEDEEEEEDEDEDEDEKEDKKDMKEAYVGFKKLKASIAAKGGARDPAAVAAAIGRKKYGKEKFQAMAATGKKKANEEVGGKTPETDTEVELAKKHGNPKKITYGDVIKARIASAKKKAVGKGE